MERQEAGERTSLEVFTNEVIACFGSNRWLGEAWHYMAEHIKEWYENEFIVRLFDNWSVKKGKLERDLLHETRKIMNGNEADTLSKYNAWDLERYERLFMNC